MARIIRVDVYGANSHSYVDQVQATEATANQYLPNYTWESDTEVSQKQKMVVTYSDGTTTSTTLTSDKAEECFEEKAVKDIMAKWCAQEIAAAKKKVADRLRAELAKKGSQTDGGN